MRLLRRQGWPNTGFFAKYPLKRNVSGSVFIYICSSCRQPTYFDSAARQWPGVSFGAAVAGLPVDVGRLYAEARQCMSVSAYTAAAMAARKLLMNVAVEQGAEANKSFKYYVDWLVSYHVLPAGSAAWVDHIRDKGNEATHEIAIVSQQDAEQVVSFIEMLLKLVYEFPARVAPSPTGA
jgi:Domain of unknown function (DUF4145)